MLTDRPIFKHEVKQTEKVLIRAAFVGNPNCMESILRVTKIQEPSSMVIK